MLKFLIEIFVSSTNIVEY